MNKKNIKTLRRLTGNGAFSLVRLTTAVALISGAAAMAFVAASPGGSPQPARTGDAASNMRVVNCDRGQNIAEVLARAEPGDTTNDNLQTGADINGTSIIEIRGAQVEASRNGSFGLVAGSNSQLAVFGFAGSRGSTFTADANVQGGIALAGSVLNVFESTTIAITNSPLGIRVVAAGVIASPFGVGTFVIENNGVGLDFALDGTALLVGGLTVRNNGTGVLGDGAGVLTFISIPENPSAITGNGVDVDLRFGARTTIEGVDVGTITCDSTVLSRGTTVCP
jgi:hypothetical protein